MKVKSSEYLKDTKPVLKKLLDKVLEEYPYASILAVDSTAANYRVTRNMTTRFWRMSHVYSARVQSMKSLPKRWVTRKF